MVRFVFSGLQNEPNTIKKSKAGSTVGKLYIFKIPLFRGISLAFFIVFGTLFFAV